MAKLRGSKEGSLTTYKKCLEEGLANPEHLVAYVKGVINSINIEIEENGSKKRKNKTD